MQTETYLYIILAAIVAIGIAVFQYFYKSKRKGKLPLILSFLRFLAIFGLFLLLINPKFTKNEYSLQKANLVFLIDNSSSVVTSKNKIISFVEGLDKDTEISEKFNLQKYTFGNHLKDGDSISFLEKNTNITKALASVKEIYAKTNTAVVLVTDGNQTLGTDYEFYGKNQEFPVYPVVVGDTTKYEDIRIAQVNVNKYAFLKNKYPLETYIAYDGDRSVAATVRVQVAGKTVATNTISLSKNENTKIVNTLLEAKGIGIKNIKVLVTTLENEKNTVNNQKNVAVEVIDEKTNIAIISSMLHPDIGALKKSIESNEQRSVSILKPSVKLKDLAEIDLFVLYQPNASFKNIYEYIKQKKASIFTVTGTKTDWGFVNRVQASFNKKSYNQSEEIIPVLNDGFSIFDTGDFSVSDFPPLENNLGAISIQKTNETLLSQQIKGIPLKDPLLSILNDEETKEAILFGENIWKWRAQTYRESQSFATFDDFMGKIVLYLATTKSKNRLVVDYKPIYEGSTNAKITASYFDESFVFNSNASLYITIKGQDGKMVKEIPLLLKGANYEADLNDLKADTYTFKVGVKNEKLTRTGTFTILDFDVEKQFLSSDYKKLGRLADYTKGKLYFLDTTEDLVSDLAIDKQYLPIQKSKENIVSLIDFRLLMALIVIALALEWFIRKYNGLI